MNSIINMALESFKSDKTNGIYLNKIKGKN